jgi:hypothetical protein
MSSCWFASWFEARSHAIGSVGAIVSLMTLEEAGYL